MEILIKNARIVTPQRTHPPQDILIHEGMIVRIGHDLVATGDAEIWDWPNAHVSLGWFDIGPASGDPGHEHREDLHSLADAAEAGGYTAIAPLPNTHPAVHGKSEVLYIKNKTTGIGINCHPLGAISVNCEGRDLAELYDMHAAGAVGFTDGENAVQDAGLLLRALQYTQAFGGLIINHPHHKGVAASGQMHEGLLSTQLGMRGIPAIAETLMLQRDLMLLEYANHPAGSRLHVHLISCAESVHLIRQAKKRGLPVTASVAVANLCYTDAELIRFDSNWKVSPPLRSRADADALLEGLLDGAIDVISSHHTPWHDEAKNLEFTYAEFGMSAIETAFAACRTVLGDRLPLNLLIEKMAYAPRQVLGLPILDIAPGHPAELTVFDPDAAWTPRRAETRSRSHNSPFFDQSLIGKPLRTLVW